MESLADEVEEVRALVGRFFPIYDIRVRPEAIAFYVRVEAQRLDESFEALRLEMRGGKYLPLLRLEGGEHVLYVQRSPPRRFRGPMLNVILLVATIGTTLFAGMTLWAGYSGTEFFSLSNVGGGALFFALPLLAILGTHEMGHFLLAKRHNVAASLPFFIPAPPPVLLGTLGALISMREPIPNKKALLDIGISGPLLGLAVALPIALLGLYLNAIDPQPVGPNPGGGLAVNFPLFYEALLFAIPLPPGVLLHPTAFAGWVGFLVTALNLLPAGQLDGGHVARALLGERARYLSYGAFFVLMGLGFVTGFFSWILLAFIVLLLGLRHPPPLNDITRLNVNRQLAGVAVLVVLLLSFHPIPLAQEPVDVALEFRDPNDPLQPLRFLNEERTIQEDDFPLTGGEGNYTFMVVNTGNVRIDLVLTLQASFENLSDWGIAFVSLDNETIPGTSANVSLNGTEAANGTVRIRAPTSVQPGTRVLLIAGELTATISRLQARHTLSLNLQV